ncbi:MAG: hypothetical protein HOV67_15670, partial [Kribbellaceae bacterium]|nr:hypothetical protein [Kribbellaceae bacterium]
MAQVSPWLSRFFPPSASGPAGFPRTLAQNTLGGATNTPRHHRGRVDEVWRGIVRKLPAGLFSLALAATAGIGWAQAGNAVSPSTQSSGPIASETAPAPDELPNPLEEKRRELRQEALTKVLSGKAKPEVRNGSTVVKVGSKAVGAKGLKAAKTGKVDQYVELAREKSDKIFVVLAEFGNERHPNYPDQDTSPNFPGPSTFEGPLRNAIPEPDRSVDNSTVWQADYSQKHFQDLYFGT